jgi:hypothetical protein
MLLRRKYPYAAEPYLNEKGRIFEKFAATIRVNRPAFAAVPDEDGGWKEERCAWHGVAFYASRTLGSGMAFLFYFAVLLFAAASAVFGLDLMTSPLPQHPTKPAVTASADAPQQAQKVATRDNEKAKSKPGERKSEVRTVYPPSNPALAAVVAKQNEAKAGAQKSPEPQSAHPGADARTQQASAQPRENVAAPSEASSARAEATGSTPPKLTESAATVDQPGAEQAANRCNVQACASAYQSFRASDCTYQPYEGPRRLCTKSAASPRVAPQAASQDRRQLRREADRNASLRDAARRAHAMRNPDDRYDAYDDASIFGSFFGRHNRRVIVVPDDRYDDYYYR